jgi:hypothetical protein
MIGAMSAKAGIVSRHCEQSEAIQTWGLRLRLRLDRVAVAGDDGRTCVNLPNENPL